MDVWRRRCPRGHASLRVFSETFVCFSCSRLYEGEPYDAAEVDEWPVEGHDSTLPAPDRKDVLEALVERCGDSTTARARARNLDVGRPKQVGQVLALLADDGLVRPVGGEHRRSWQPTPAGIDAVRGQDRVDDRRVDADQRAQLTPVGTAILVGVVGALLLLAIAVGVVL